MSTLVEAKAEAGIAQEHNKTALHVAAEQGRCSCVEWLLALNPPPAVDTQDICGSTPLFLAASRGEAVVAEILLAAGASPDVAQEDGSTPQRVAEAQGHHRVVLVLKNAANRRNWSRGNTAEALHRLHAVAEAARRETPATAGL